MAFRFSERDVRDGAQEKLVAEPDFADGLPFARRSCTDPACGCLLVVAWVAAAALGMTAVSDGAPHRLEGALDYDGRVCGHSAGVAPRPLWYATTVGGGGVCVASCPSVNNFNDIDGGEPLDKSQMICKEAAVWDAPGGKGERVAIEFVNLTPIQAYKYGWCNFQYKSYSANGRCAFEDGRVASSFNTDTGLGPLGELAADLYRSYGDMILFGFFLGGATGFAYTVGLRVPFLSRLWVWIAVWVAYVFLLAFSGHAYYISQWFHTDESDTHKSYEVNALTGAAFLGFLLATTFLTTMLSLRRPVATSAGVMIEASRVAVAMPDIALLFPLCLLLAMAAFTSLMGFFFVNAASLGNLETVVDSDTDTTYVEYVASSNVVTYSAAMLFVLFWTCQFIAAVGQLTVSLATSRWYFTRNKGEITSTTLTHSFKLVCCSHLGTAAAGSLAMIFTTVPRALVQYTERSVRHESGVGAAVLFCCNLCVCCIEGVLKYISPHAYVHTAVWGKGLGRASRNSFYLVTRNLSRVSAVVVTHSLVCVVGKFTCTTLCACSYYFLIASERLDETHTLIGSTLVVAFLAWQAATLFVDTWSTIARALIQCLVADEEMFMMRDQFAERELRLWVDTYGSEFGKATM